MALTLSERALRLLALRDHSRLELARKLGSHASPDEVESVLDRMQELGFLSDSRYAESYIRSHAERFGAARLRAELGRRGVAAELIDTALGAQLAEAPDELEQARRIWHNKFATAPADPREWARQARFLQGRGFSPATIRTLLKDPFDEPA